MPDETTTPDEKPAQEEVSIGDFINALDMEELDFVENISGCSLDEMEVPGRAKSLFIAAVALVAKRRSVPNFSWSEARALNMSQVKTIIAEAASVKKAPATKSKQKNA